MTKSFTTTEITFTSNEEALAWMAGMGLRRVDRLGFAGRVYGDLGERIDVIARKSGALSYSLHERAA